MLVRSLAAAAILAAFLPHSQSQAEPQILALLNTDNAKPMTCDGRECFVELSAYCMEPGRAGPDHESPYSLAEGSRISLVVTDQNGVQQRTTVGSEVSFISQRGYAAVRMSVPQGAINPQSRNVSVEVSQRVVLLPVWQENYHREHEPEQIAAAVGPNRLVGQNLVDNGGEKAAAARFLSHMINALPERAAVTPEARKSVWQRAARLASEQVRQQGSDIAEDIYENCLAAAAKDDLFTFRHCLQRGHDRTLWLLNHAYWKAVGPQS